MSENKRYAYITYQDIRRIPCYANETVMAIKAPPEAKLEVPDPAGVYIREHIKFAAYRKTQGTSFVRKIKDYQFCIWKVILVSFKLFLCLVS